MLRSSLFSPIGWNVVLVIPRLCKFEHPPTHRQAHTRINSNLSSQASTPFCWLEFFSHHPGVKRGGVGQDCGSVRGKKTTLR